MKIDLSKLHDDDVNSISFNGEIRKEMLDIGGRRIEFISPIKYNGSIYKVDSDKILHVDITYAYKEPCGRCLEPLRREEETVLSEKLLHQSDVDSNNENDNIIYNYDEKLDLTEEILNTIVLSLPMKPLCSEDCKGICSQCGINLNKKKCDCVVDNIDPRFAVLKDLRLDD